MTNGKVRFFSVAIAGILAGCSVLDGVLGKKIIPSKSRKGVSVCCPTPSRSSATTGSVSATTEPGAGRCIRFGGRAVGDPPGSNYSCPPGVTPPPDPSDYIGTTGKICPSGRYFMLGAFRPLPGGVGRGLNFSFSCGTSKEHYDYSGPIVPASIGERLWVFVGSGSGYSDESMLVFRLEEANDSALFERRDVYIGSKTGKSLDGKREGLFAYDFSVNTLPGDVESRASSSLTFTEQGKSRFGSSTFEWPCAPDEEYGNTKPTASDPVPNDFSGRFFAVGNKYVIRSLSESSYEQDGNGEQWQTIKKVLQTVRRDGRTFKVISKYQRPIGEFLEFYGSLANSVRGMDSFVWSVQLKAFVRNPFGYGLSEKIQEFEVLTEEDLDTLLAANEGSPCGIE